MEDIAPWIAWALDFEPWMVLVLNNPMFLKNHDLQDVVLGKVRIPRTKKGFHYDRFLIG